MTERQSPTFRAKAQAAFIALAAGDALGWPQELPNKVLGDRGNQPVVTSFRTWLRRGGGRFYPHEERIEAGEYSDDTQLTLAVARWRMYGGTSWWSALTRTELPLWSLYERGGGGATKRAVKMWIKGTPPWNVKDSKVVRRYFDAGGNGVTMRVLPHAIFYACKEDPFPLMRDVVKDGVATHGHPRALVGATTYAFAAWWLLRSDRTVRFGELVKVVLEKSTVWGALPASNSPRNGWFDAANRNTPDGYEGAWSSVVDEMRELLRRVEKGLNAGALADDDEILRDLGCFGKAKGAGTVSTAAAVYLCARYAAQPAQAVLKAAFAHRADTDTVAAMCGGLVGCLAGEDWLPREWTSVQDYEYLRRMANEVSQGPPAVHERPTALHTITQGELDALRSALADGQEYKLNLDGIREAEVTGFICPESLSRTTFAQVWRLQVSDGQTLFVTKLGRKAPSESRTESHQSVLSEPSFLRTSGRAPVSATAVGLKLTVKDLKAMMAFYEGVLGLPAGKRSRRFVSFGALSLIDAKAAAELSGGVVDPSAGARHSRIQVQVNDIYAAHRCVQQAGSRVVQPVTGMPWGDRVFHCLDPEGNLVEVVQGL